MLIHNGSVLRFLPLGHGAMSFAVAALRAPGIRLRDPGCVAKTFPSFFDVLDAATP